jgi:hypothetical protein
LHFNVCIETRREGWHSETKTHEIRTLGESAVL